MRLTFASDYANKVASHQDSEAINSNGIMVIEMTRGHHTAFTIKIFYNGQC